MTEPKKPEKKTRQYCYYDWFEFDRYLAAKYPDYPTSTQFWEYLCSLDGFSNDSYVLFSLERALVDDCIDRDVQYTAELIRDEVALNSDSTHMFWVSW